MNFTECVKTHLRELGWEIYPHQDSIHEWWWLPSEHKDYWRDPKNKDAPRHDWYMPLDQAIGQQMLRDKERE